MGASVQAGRSLPPAPTASYFSAQFRQLFGPFLRMPEITVENRDLHPRLIERVTATGSGTGSPNWPELGFGVPQPVWDQFLYSRQSGTEPWRLCYGRVKATSASFKASSVIFGCPPA